MAVFADYVRVYDQIADDDLQESIQGVSDLAVKARVVARLAEPLRGKALLDVGVGQGYLLNEALGRGARVTGIDIATSYLTRLRRDEAELLAANAENLPFADEFDIVALTDVLEHVISPVDALISARRALRRRGA
jgi:2-polyprenyl-3-methyl-5-hydroxy-6-metoxy-1,4-benzoquinol methylase